jgi:2'-5' RNA ligase
MHMRTAIALIVDDDIANQMTAITLRCREYGFSFRALRLAPHVSLKQPFIVSDFERYESFFADFASRIAPQSLRFDGFRFWGNAEEGVVTAHVAESAHLHKLHAQLNSELEQNFGDTHADFDGDEYEFHLTVAIGSCHAHSLPQFQTALATWKLDQVTVASRLAMFIYEEALYPHPLFGVREYGTYKVLPLTQQGAKS